VPRAGAILRANHYGWFDRVARGRYDLSPKGRRDLVRWKHALDCMALQGAQVADETGQRPRSRLRRELG
jgi:hypothetical protein